MRISNSLKNKLGSRQGVAVSDKGGFVLILTLWALGFLTVLALAVGFGSRQKIALLERLEDRSRDHLVAEAGAKKAIALLVDDLENNQFKLTAPAKARRHNAPAEFKNYPVGDLAYSVTYETDDEKTGTLVEHYGLADEQSKLNLNTIDLETLARLLSDVLRLTTDDARRQAESIIDWRDFGKHEAEGFFSDDYYKNLEFPYDMKEHPFERIDELLLVKGMDGEKFVKLIPYVSVWGSGRVNINTASQKVLSALGLEPAVIEKILKVRQGPDGIDSTADDHIFLRTFDIASDVKAVISLDDREARQIDALNAKSLFSTDSLVYSVRSRAFRSDGMLGGSEVAAVFDAGANKIIYWYEK